VRHDLAVGEGLCFDGSTRHHRVLSLTTKSSKQKLTTHHSRRDRVGLLPTMGRHAKKHAPLTASFA